MASPAASSGPENIRSRARIAGCRSSDAEVAENEARRRLRARDDPRNTSAGMRARAGKIEVLDARVAVVPAKIGALQQCWRQAEGAPEMRGEILFEEIGRASCRERVCQ